MPFLRRQLSAGRGDVLHHFFRHLTKVAERYLPDHFSFWQKELAKLGHAVIHDKILVVDPFRDDCSVITGSHNLGFKASYSNDWSERPGRMADNVGLQPSAAAAVVSRHS